MRTRYAWAAAGAAAAALVLAADLTPLRAGVDTPPFAVTVPFDPYTVVLPGAGSLLQSGSSQNTLGGIGSGGSAATTTYNTGWGYKTLAQSLSHAGTAVGAGAGASVGGPGADDNSFFAADAGNNDDNTGLITGTNNLGSGVHSLGHLGSGSQNVATGNESMVGCGTWSGVPSCPLLSGSGNTATGDHTLAYIQGAARRTPRMATRPART
jgi:hypothetical protein